MVVGYSPEYRTTGVNTTFLHTLAAAGGGSVISNAGAVWRNNLQSVLADDDLTLWLLLLAILLLPIDIGVRRLVMTRQELAELVARLPVLGHAPAAREPAVPVMGALRERRARRGPAFPALREGGRMPGRIESVVRPVASVAAESSETESAAARLLASRRKRSRAE
jgi:hypothetical protein